ncbi:MAG: glycosyltransferase family 2 protein [Saprospiraceae bacterium]
MSSAHLVSIIIPFYNAQHFLTDTLNSVLQQTYSNLEIILINDGSTDNSLEIATGIKDSRIKIINQTNQGQSAAANKGISESKGDYIKFLDADDLISPDHISLQVNRLAGSEEYLASCEWGRFYQNDLSTAKFIPETVWEDLEPLEWLKRAMRQPSDMMGGWLWLIPRQILEKAGGWDERLSLNNDFDFSVRLILASKGIKFTKGARLYYRSGLASSLSNSLSKKAIESALLTTDLGCQHILKHENSEVFQKLCADRYQTWAYRIYPEYPAVVKIFETRAKELGGSGRRLEGGKVLISLSYLLGWKRAKKLQRLLYKLGYKPKSSIKVVQA